MTEHTEKQRGLLEGKVVFNKERKESKEASSTRDMQTTLPVGPSRISGMDWSPMIHNHG